MSGPIKQFQEVIIVPVTPEMKAALKMRAGRLNMSALVRGLIEEYLGDLGKIKQDQEIEKES